MGIACGGGRDFGDIYVIPSRHTAPSSSLNVLHQEFSSRERQVCPHFEGGEAVDPEILGDSLRGTQ